MDSGFLILLIFGFHEDTDLFIYVQYDYLAFREMIWDGKIVLKTNMLIEYSAKNGQRYISEGFEVIFFLIYDISYVLVLN